MSPSASDPLGWNAFHSFSVEASPLVCLAIQSDSSSAGVLLLAFLCRCIPEHSVEALCDPLGSNPECLETRILLLTSNLCICLHGCKAPEHQGWVLRPHRGRSHADDGTGQSISAQAYLGLQEGGFSLCQSSWEAPVTSAQKLLGANFLPNPGWALVASKPTSAPDSFWSFTVFPGLLGCCQPVLRPKASDSLFGVRPGSGKCAMFPGCYNFRARTSAKRRSSGQGLWTPGCWW